MRVLRAAARADGAASSCDCADGKPKGPVPRNSPMIDVVATHLGDVCGENEDRTQNYCFSFSRQFSGLTKMITSPGFGDAVALPQVFAVATPC
jgi:hypothetical protein